MKYDKSKLGYRFPSEIKLEIKSLHKTNPIHFIVLIVIDHFFIWIPTTLIIFFLKDDALLYLSYLFVLILSTRSLRGLECLIHEASHYNFIRRRRKRNLNDTITNVFCGYPVFSTVQQYRESHLNHHVYLGKEIDPDYIRHKEMLIVHIDEKSKTTALMSAVKLFPVYVPSWWKAIGTNFATALKGILWHTCFFLFISLSVNSIESAVVIWSLAFAIPFFVFLPFLRFVGESSEHNYKNNEDFTIAVNTYTNSGFIQKVIFHPHGDGFHTLHHLAPTIPHHKLPRLHKKLKNIDSDNYLNILRERKKLFK